MSALAGHVSDYLAMRRALGYKLERAGQLLPQLVSYLEARGAPTVTAELAIAWARLPEHATPRHWAQRLAVARRPIGDGVAGSHARRRGAGGIYCPCCLQ